MLYYITEPPIIQNIQGERVPKKKPDCGDFIIAAIRTLRLKSSKLKPGTHGCAMPQEIFRFARELYTETEFRRSFETLMSSKAVVFVADVIEMERVSEEEKVRGSSRYEKMTTLPPNVSFVDTSWNLSMGGEPIDPKKIGKYRQFTRMHVYVTADGLPLKVAKLADDRNVSPSPTLMRILANIKKNRE